MLTIIARSVRGLEWVAADEISASVRAARAISLSSREVTFQVPALGSSVLSLRTVDDAFVEVGRVSGVGSDGNTPPRVARRIAGLDWARALTQLAGVRAWRPQPQLDVVASLEGQHSYNRFALENAVGVSLAPLIRSSYLARTSEGRQAGQPDLMVRVFVRDGEVVAALRLAARPLHRRAYKLESGAGTLHPPVAASLARLASPATTDIVADPFCGDGTVAIETSLSRPGVRVLAADIDPARLAHAERNAGRAGVQLSLCLLDAGQLPWPRHSVGAVITNPPWNVAVDAAGLLRNSLDPFWRQLPGLLARGGRLCLIADAQLDAPGQLRRMGYRLALGVQVRLAGRVSHVLLCAPPEQDVPRIPAGAAAWRQRALAEGVVTETGF